MNTFECNLCGGKGEHLHWCPRSVDSWSASIPMTGTWGDAANALSRSGVELKVETETIEDVLRDVRTAYPDVVITGTGNWTWPSSPLPERSEWVCYMFGTSKENAPYNVWYPMKNQVPNAFTRWMMKVCFACTWVKERQ